jgi:hypothetical protein
VELIPPSPQSPKIASVSFGENKAFSALSFSTEGGKQKLGAIFHIPTRQEGPKTFYKRLACEIEISEAQRREIITLLGGSIP